MPGVWGSITSVCRIARICAGNTNGVHDIPLSVDRNSRPFCVPATTVFAECGSATTIDADPPKGPKAVHCANAAVLEIKMQAIRHAILEVVIVQNSQGVAKPGTD